MSDWPGTRALGPEAGSVLSTLTWLDEMGARQAPVATQAHPSANLAIFVPCRVGRMVTVHQIAFGCGSGSAGNADVGIYDHFGNRVISTGPVAMASNQEMIINFVPPEPTLGPGHYYLAMAVDGVHQVVCVVPPGTDPVPLQRVRLLGVLHMDQAFPLPEQATFVGPAIGPVIPAVAAYLLRY